MNTERAGSIFTWQFNGYPRVHADRRNLLIHAMTVPVFMGGTILAITGPLWAAGWGAVVAVAAGIFAMIVAVGLQGKGHRGEANAPEPFRGAGDVVMRIFVEQWVTFPRFVLSGGFRRALHEWGRSALQSSSP